MSTSSDRSSDGMSMSIRTIRRIKIRSDLSKNFTVTFDNLIETQTFNHYDARLINSEIKMMTISNVHSIMLLVIE